MLQRFELTRAARSFPERVLYYAELWTGGMFLQQEAYIYMLARRNPFASGLLYVALVGLLVALAGIFGAFARYATSPSLDAVKNTVLVHLQALPLYDNLGLVAQRTLNLVFSQAWEWIGPLFLQYPNTPAQITQLLLTTLTTPAGLVFSWVFYGALVHFMARKWNPEISFGAMLGPLALAESPQLLSALNLFPNVSVNFWVGYLWFFVCAVTAIRITYRTTNANAFRAAFFPVLVSLVLVVVLILLALVWLVMRGGQ